MKLLELTVENLSGVPDGTYSFNIPCPCDARTRFAAHGGGAMTTGGQEPCAAQRAHDSDTDPRWHVLALGALSEAEAEALRQEAQLSEEGRLLYEMFRPFDERELARIAEGVCNRLREGDARRGCSGKMTGLKSPRGGRD